MLLWTHSWSDIHSGKKSYKDVLFILVKHTPQQAGSHEMNPLICKEPRSQITCLYIGKLSSYCSDNHASVATPLTIYTLWHMALGTCLQGFCPCFDWPLIAGPITTSSLCVKGYINIKRVRGNITDLCYLIISKPSFEEKVTFRYINRKKKQKFLNWCAVIPATL